VYSKRRPVELGLETSSGHEAATSGCSNGLLVHAVRSDKASKLKLRLYSRTLFDPVSTGTVEGAADAEASTVQDVECS
jgi:hypothetical protein